MRGLTLQQLQLFSIDKTEEIRLRVGFVTLKHRLNELRKAVAASRPIPRAVVQAVFWGPPLIVGPRQQSAKPQRAPVKPRAPASVFDLAAMGLCLKVRLIQPQEAGEQRRSIREDGITRSIGAAYPSNRWTPEKEEQERARRARQKPPRPPKGAKTRSRKLLEMVGEDD